MMFDHKLHSDTTGIHQRSASMLADAAVPPDPAPAPIAGDNGQGNPSRDGLTSIVIVTHNQLAHTRRCLDSVARLTPEPHEVIVVDNSSTDGTRAYLESLPGVRVILNSGNRGFPAAANQGILAANGEDILLLNNDTIVTAGWLGRLRAALSSDDAVGLVGPVSNNVSGGQQVPAIYSNESELAAFARERGRLHAGEAQRTDRLVGFCLLFRRAVVERVGLLDERFGMGNFEDDDFCRRARAAGFRALIVRDAFVHHVGSATFRGEGIDLAQVLSRNRRLYEEKWLRLSCCMIVRDNEGTIRPCLESIRPWVDEIVVVDTGSQDRTPEICAELGARMLHWKWRDDFAAARNVSFDHARGDWLFWMDSDDVISPDCGRRLRELADGEHAEDLLGYVMQVHCPGRDAHDVTVVDHVKLVRNRPDLRFEFRIHEQILPAIRRAGGEVAFTDIFVVHSGADQSEAGRRRKRERDFRLLDRELRDRPDHPFVLFNLGMTHVDAGQHAAAVACLVRCTEVSRPGESHLRKAYALLIGALSQLDRHDEAEEWSRRGRRLFPDDKELLFREAILHQRAGRLVEAERSYLRLLQEQGSRCFASVDAGIAGYKARHNLAVVYEEQGRLAEAADQWRRIIAQHPAYRAARQGLTSNLLRQAKWDQCGMRN